MPSNSEPTADAFARLVPPEVHALPLGEALERMADEYGWDSREVQLYRDYRMGLTPDE